MLVGLEDVAEIGAVEDVFEGREDADPDVRSIFAGYESAVKLLAKADAIRSGGRCGISAHTEVLACGMEIVDLLAGVEQKQPAEDGERREEELTCYGQDEGEHDEGGQAHLHHWSRRLRNAEVKDAREQ